MWHPHLRFVIVPGLHGSGPAHWQTLWEVSLGATRVHQDDWSDAQLSPWANRLRAALVPDSRPAVVIAHSFGCLAVVRAWPQIHTRVHAALLVAPANPSRFGLRLDDVGGPLTAPSLLAASRNDPWLPFDLAQTLSALWSAPLVDLGEAGHVNTESGHGTWPQGLELLDRLMGGTGLDDRVTARSGPAAPHARRSAGFVL